MSKIRISSFLEIKTEADHIMFEGENDQKLKYPRRNKAIISENSTLQTKGYRFLINGRKSVRIYDTEQQAEDVAIQAVAASINNIALILNKMKEERGLE